MGVRTWRPDGPGSFQAPDGVRTVQDRTGHRWTRSGARWTCTGSRFIRWRVLVAEHGPVTEDRPTTENRPTQCPPPAPRTHQETL